MNASAAHTFLQRRHFLGLFVAAASAALLAACTPSGRSGGQRIDADDSAVRAAEDARPSSGREPVPAALPSRINGEVFDGGRLTSAASVGLPRKPVTVRHAVRLTGSMMGYSWGINGRRFAMDSPYDGALAVRQGDRVQLDFMNPA